MNNGDKIALFSIIVIFSVICFSIGIGNLTTFGVGWVIAGLGLGCALFLIFEYIKFIEKQDKIN